jgi:predicted transposase YdaD
LGCYWPVYTKFAAPATIPSFQVPRLEDWVQIPKICDHSFLSYVIGMSSPSDDREPDEKIHHPKDNFNRKWFGDPEAAAPVLQVSAPASLRPLIVPENLTLEPVSFIDKKLRPTQSDLLWSCRSPDSDGDQVLAYFYILWEHQSSIDRWMVLRIFCYMAQIWERWLATIQDTKDPDEKRTEKKLPLIFPLVIYQGEADWTAPLSLSELTRGVIPDDIKPYFPDFKFHLESIKAMPDGELPPGLAQLGVSVMKLMWDDDFIGWLNRMRDQLLELQKRGEEDKITVLLVYAFSQIDRTKRREFIEHIYENLNPMTTNGQSIYDSLIEEGMEKGMEKGSREAATVILEKLFGEVPESVTHLVERASEATLSSLIREAWDLGSMVQVEEWLVSREKPQSE